MEDITQCFRWCERLCRASGSSFFSSFRLLKGSRRDAMYALYAFSRISDDLSDASSDPTLALQRLQEWRCQLHDLDDAQARASRECEHRWLAEYAPLWPALQAAANDFGIPHQLLEDIVVGVTQDVQGHTIDTWDQLEDYCYHVASAVGLACTHIWKSGDEIPTQAAVDCGIAFQLTNILRDVAAGVQLGRVYFPNDLLAQHGIERESILRLAPAGRWDALLDTVGARAKEKFAAGWPVIEALSPDSQRMFSLMWRSYRSLLDEVLNHRSQLLTGARITVPRSTRLQLALYHLVSPLYHRLGTPRVSQT